MVFLYINKKNYNEGNKNLVKELDDLMGKKNNKIYTKKVFNKKYI